MRAQETYPMPDQPYRWGEVETPRSYQMLLICPHCRAGHRWVAEARKKCPKCKHTYAVPEVER